MRAHGAGVVVLVLFWLGAWPSEVAALGSCGVGGALGTRLMTDFQGSLYYITTPAGYDESRPWPLIFGLHGDEGDPAMSVNWNWRGVFDDRFIFVAPKASNASGSWYEAREQNSMWMDALVEDLLAKYNVDLDRTYIWGLSGGAEFISSYALERQDRFAAVQYNMGGNRWGWVQAGSPSPDTCKIPARFVVSMNDFLRDGARSLYDELTKLGHETVWLDANCDGHCWDNVESGPGARDWLLGHTLCGMVRPEACEGDPAPPDAGMPTTDAGTAPPTGTPDAGVPPPPVAGMSAPMPVPTMPVPAPAPTAPTGAPMPVPPVPAGTTVPALQPSERSSGSDASSGCTVAAGSGPGDWLLAMWLMVAVALVRRSRSGPALKSAQQLKR